MKRFVVASVLVVALAACSRGYDAHDVVDAAAPTDDAAASSTSSPLGWCPAPRPEVSNEGADLVDFVMLDGVMYVNQSPRRASLSEALLGEQVGVVCQDHIGASPEGAPRDGDAARLVEGTSVHAVVGYPTTFRIAAVRDGEVVIFEADTVDRATVGRDLIDVGGVTVDAITINDEKDAITELARIEDRPTIDRLVAMIHEARIDPAFGDQSGPRYFVELVMADGTTVNRSFWLDTGELWRGIYVAPEFADTVRAAVP